MDLMFRKRIVVSVGIFSLGVSMATLGCKSSTTWFAKSQPNACPTLFDASSELANTTPVLLSGAPAIEQVSHIAFELEEEADEGKGDAEGKGDSEKSEKQDESNKANAPLPVAEQVPLVEYSSAGMSLNDFVGLAVAHNPTLRELALTTQKAVGFREQVGLRANPTIGYQAMQLADEGTDQHTAFIEQEIVTAGKLQLNRNVLNETLRAQRWELDTQRYRVTTDIQVKFYEALAAQQRIKLISDFQSVASKGLELAELRLKAMEGSKVEVLQAKIQASEIELALQQAKVEFEAAWKSMAALVGCPELQPVDLVGELSESVTEEIEWTTTLQQLVMNSPEFNTAQARVAQARAALERHGVQAIPNVKVQLAAGFDNGTDSGMMNLQVGAPIPVFNKNQGNIAAARAEYCRAVMEVQRIERSIQLRLADVSRNFESSLAAVKQYRSEILPSAQETLGLAEEAYKAGESSFLEVLFVRRTYFQSNLEYLKAQSQLAQADALVDGFVLTGGLEPIDDQSGDDSLRGLTFSQQ